MKAFLNDKEVKKKYLARVRSHALADEIIKGRYWREGKGCAVGCTVHSSEHKAYEIELGIPEWLAAIEDTLFEGMSVKDAQKWPEQFLQAINVGADLEQVKVPFTIFILKSSLKSMKAAKFDAKKFPEVKIIQEQCEAAVKEIIRCHKLGLSLEAAYSAADSAANSSADFAADSANFAANFAARSANFAAYSAAYSATRSADFAADFAARAAADSAAYSAADSAYLAARSAAYFAADSAAYFARSAAYLKFSKELLRLLRACKK